MTRDAPRRRKRRRSPLHLRGISLKPGFRRRNTVDNLQKLQALSGNGYSSHLQCLQEELNSSVWLPKRLHPDCCGHGLPIHADEDILDADLAEEEDMADAHLAEEEDILFQQDANQGLQLFGTGGNNHGTQSAPSSTVHENNRGLQLFGTGGNHRGTQSAPSSTVHENNRVSLGSMLLIWKCWCGIIRRLWYMEHPSRPAGGYMPDWCDACDQTVDTTLSF